MMTMRKAIFYHAGCPVCASAEQDILNLVDKSRVDLEVVHLGQSPDRIRDAEQAGIASVPALVLDGGNVLHLNFGASLEAVKKSAGGAG
jgi:glutaredoxin